MPKQYYSITGEHIATGYDESETEGAGYFLLFLIALPFLLFALFLQAAAKFITEHSVLVSIIYFAVLLLIAIFIYCTSENKFKLVGIPAMVINFIPLYLYIRGELPAIIAIEGMGELVGYSISWIIVTVIILAISIFLTAMGMLTKNGIWHMGISIASLVLGIFLFV